MGAETAGECAIALPAIRQATIERAAQMEIDLHCYKCGSELDGYPSAARGGGGCIRVYPCEKCAASGGAVANGKQLAQSAICARVKAAHLCYLDGYFGKNACVECDAARKKQAAK